MDSALFFVGLAVFVFAAGYTDILPLVGTYLRNKHIEKIISQLPEARREEYIRKYLDQLKNERSKDAQSSAT